MAQASKIIGMKELKGRLKNLPETARKPMADLLLSAAVDTATEAKRLVQRGPKSGRMYRRRSVIHRASAPGQPPATDTGFLAAHIRASMARGKRLAAEAVSGAEYSDMLEFGTSRMGARPFMTPAFEHAKDGFKKRRKVFLKKFTRSAGKG